MRELFTQQRTVLNTDVSLNTGVSDLEKRVAFQRIQAMRTGDTAQGVTRLAHSVGTDPEGPQRNLYWGFFCFMERHKRHQAWSLAFGYLCLLGRPPGEPGKVRGPLKTPGQGGDTEL